MKFGTIPTADALGAILAHSVQLSQGRMRKGKVLTAQDISQLSADGVAAVTVAQLGPDDVHEDVAAQRLAHAFVDAAHGLRLSEATTGRVNVIATQPGVFCGDVAAINAVNAVDPAITIATLSQYKRVAAGDMVATIKIISYGVAQQDLQKACNAAQPLALRPAIHGAVTLIETQIGTATPSPKGRNAIATRLERLGASLTNRVVVPHDEKALTQAIAAAPGSLILILTASATSDLYDVAPNAVRQAGGTISRFGMPVDPGNLLFTGDFGPKPIIGLPGCARSLALNGADWVLERIICGIAVSNTDIASMGVGGLLKESPARQQPRAGHSKQ